MTINAICNAISLNMLSDPFQEGAGFRVVEVNPDVSKLDLSYAVAGIGHQDTANVVAKTFGLPVEKISGRPTLQLESGDQVLVFQYTGPRLPAGATELPEGATLTPLIIDITCN
jgi:hypothetical protein